MELVGWTANPDCMVWSVKPVGGTEEFHHTDKKVERRSGGLCPDLTVSPKLVRTHLC